MPTNSSSDDYRILSSQDLAAQSANLVLDKKAKEVVIMDLRGLTSVTDFFVLCTGESDVQIKAIVDYLDESLRMEDTKPFHIEGYDQLNWVLVDYVDVVVHVFLAETRDYYGLERLWADAKVKQVTDSDS
jgi:ribosome-associated protein